MARAFALTTGTSVELVDWAAAATAVRIRHERAKCLRRVIGLAASGLIWQVTDCIGRSDRKKVRSTDDDPLATINQRRSAECGEGLLDTSLQRFAGVDHG